MLDESAYTKKQWIVAVNLSAIFGWASVVMPMLWRSDFGLLVWSAVVGLPIALLACWTIGAPILKRIMLKSITWFAAACWGGLIALVISLTGSFLGRVYGLWTYLDDSSFYQLGGGEYVREVDGILTNYGWLMLAKSTMVFVLTGILISMLVRLIIGPGASAHQNDIN